MTPPSKGVYWLGKYWPLALGSVNSVAHLHQKVQQNLPYLLNEALKPLPVLLGLHINLYLWLRDLLLTKQTQRVCVNKLLSFFLLICLLSVSLWALIKYTQAARGKSISSQQRQAATLCENQTGQGLEWQSWTYHNFREKQAFKTIV